jgi:hypothetical protein
MLIDRTKDKHCDGLISQTETLSYNNNNAFSVVLRHISELHETMGKLFRPVAFYVKFYTWSHLTTKPTFVISAVSRNFLALFSFQNYTRVFVSFTTLAVSFSSIDFS